MSVPSDNMPATPSGFNPTPDEKTLAMLSHILGIFTGFLGCLILWLIKKDQSAFVNDQAREALNFQITLLIAYAICFVLIFIFIGLLLMPLLVIGNIVFCIIGGLKANNGEAYRYPFVIRLIK